MATTLKPVDVVIVGFGWTGGILAKELAPTGLKIVALERGGPRDTNPDFTEPRKDDELRYAVRYDLMQDVTRETVTFRNSGGQTALPMRQLGSFLPGDGVGGAGVHWNGLTWRWLEWDHAPRSTTTQRYGAGIIPADMMLADWPVSYAELEPYYDKFEKTAGTTGKAGNLGGRRIDGGNVFEGPRRNEYPLPPLKQPYSQILFEKAARDLGYHPFPGPASNASDTYTNPDGITFGACHYCGFCERFGCEANAKGSAHFTVIPVAMQNPNFELRTNARVMKVNLDNTGKHATGVTYMDARGREIVQPAELVILSAYALGNVHLMLLSGIGKPYDPASGSGTIGRNYAYQGGGGAVAFFDENTQFHPYMGAGALSSCFDDFNGGNYDFAKEGSIGGGLMLCSQSGGRPIGFHPAPAGTPRWGSAWKREVVQAYNRTTTVGNMGSVMPYRQNHLDLDPTYRDGFGRPLMRMTFDFQPNEIKQMNAQADRAVQVARAMGARHVDRVMPPIPYSVVPYQSTHNTGGSIMGHDPSESAVNRYLQSWDVPNVFVLGASALPHNAGKNPTGPVAALAFWAADAIRNQYLKNPGALVHS
jgi:gluconate 2-dehydrogenase alpha chain